MATSGEKQQQGPAVRKTISLPMGTYERLKAKADRMYRSISGEVDFLLDEDDRREGAQQ